jgi:endoglucanase
MASFRRLPLLLAATLVSLASCASAHATTDPSVPASTALTVAASAGPGLVAPPVVETDPLQGVTFFVDHDTQTAQDAEEYPSLGVIASQPGVARFGTFSGPNVGLVASNYLQRAAIQEPGTVPMLSTYRIVDGHCGHWADPPADQRSYHNFIESLSQGIGDFRAVMFLEMDSLITTGCLSRHGVTVRMHELNDAINILTASNPGLVVYLDAGAADAVPARPMARLLERAGIAKIQGFFLNSTHFDWTSHEISYGEQISALTGGKHFVVSTSVNGRGPLVPRRRVTSGNEVLCNPPNRGLGPKPTADTGYPNVDAFAWIGNPGYSGGQCRPGAPPTGQFWLAMALQLVRNANFAVQ